MFAHKNLYFLILTWKVIEVYCLGCPAGQQNVYKKVQDEADLVFQANISSNGTVVTYSIRFYTGFNLYTVAYLNNNVFGTPSVNGCTFIGDTSTGNLAIRIGQLTLTDAGVYRLERSSNGPATVTACVTLFLLGRPTIPTIVPDKNPEVGKSASLTCNSTSTTTPSNHSLSLEYKWMLNGTLLQSNSKYTVSGNKLIVSGVERKDSWNRFTCNATEVITNRYPSVTSSNFMINVLYGPLNINFTPSKDLYEETEDTIIPQVTCSADCNTVCTYRWDKVSPTTTLLIRSTILNLGKLHRSEAGIYRCTARRDGSNILTKDLTVNVIFGPDKMSFNPSTTSYSQDEGSTLSPIICSAQCWNCTYQWTGPNSFISSGPILKLSTLTRSEDGEYTCTARNTKTAPQTQQTKSLVVKVRYGPDALSLTPPNKEYTQNENTVLADITCDAACYPTCTYTWTNIQTNNVESRTGVLSLGTLDKNKAATYTCTATNPEKSGTKSKQVKVLVRYGPDALSLTPAKKEYTQNEKTVLADITCDAACYPTCTYTWTNLQTNTVESHTGVLSLGTLDQKKAASYQCTATNPAKSGTVSKQVKVLVRYGPDKCYTNVSSKHTVTEGDNPVSITCTSDCYPSCSYQWRNVTGDKVIKQDGNMELGLISRYEAGSYKCMCQNDAQEYRISKDTTILLIVQYPPDVSIISSSTNFTEGNTLSLHCEAKGVPPVYTYTGFIQTWNGTRIHNQHIAASGNEANRAFNTNALQVQDSGIYTCYVNNKIKNKLGVLEDSVASFAVDVKGKPKIKGTNKFAGKTNENISVEMEFYSYPAVKTVEFKRYDGTVITNSSNKYTVSHYGTQIIETFYGSEVKLNGSVAQMVITDLVKENFGNYTLTLSNVVGNSPLNFVIVAESKPSKPTNFSYSYEDSRHFFSWVGDFNGGHNQTFVIQTTPLGKTDWVNRTSVEEKQGEVYQANITTLLPGIYNARIYSWNSIGLSEYVNLTETITVEDTTTSSPFPVAGAVGGGVGSGVVVLLIVAGVVFWKKRRNKSKDGHKVHLKEGDASGADDEDEVNTVNPMYISADDVNERNTTYAQPVKGQRNDVYAMVNKKPKVDSDANNLYAFPDKKDNKKQKKEGKEVKPKKKKAVVDGDIYENADELPVAKKKPGLNYGENPYENPETSVKPKRNVNKDGLIYADLAFNDQPKGQKKLVIHGLDSMTEYVEVDFTKRADPLPDSDEEKENNS